MISMHHQCQPRSAGPTSGATGADQAVEKGAHKRRPPARAFRRLHHASALQLDHAAPTSNEPSRPVAPCAVQTRKSKRKYSISWSLQTYILSSYLFVLSHVIAWCCPGQSQTSSPEAEAARHPGPSK